VTLAGVGDVTFDDVRVASISRAPIFAFNVTVKSAVEMRARAENVQIFSQNVIYRFFDDALSFLVSRLPKNEVVEVLATADVKQIFMLNGRRRNDAQLICAGCSVSDGELLLKGDFRVVREGKVMLPKVRIRSLRHLKEEVSRVAKGKDCGIVLEDQIDLGIGDKIQLVARKYVPRQLDDSEARGYASRDDVY
jgi:translation initiation factor IF-2